MFSVEEVKTYIESNIFHAQPYDTSMMEDRERANNQAWNTLTDYIAEDVITLRDLAEQVVFVFKIDSTLQRADLGVNFVTVDGIQMTIQKAERTLAPGVMKRHDISSSRTRKVGSYHVDLDHTFRYGNGG